MRHVIVLSALAVLFCAAAEIEARDFRVNLIPNGSVNSCANCHVSAAGGGTRNAFGQAVEARVTPGGTQAFWNATLAAMDSDNDGFTNGEELGDPDGDGTPTTGAQVTNPGDRNSVPQVTNNAPVIASIGAKSVNEGEALTFTVSATDQDNDAVTIIVSGLPTGASFSNNSFSWTPGVDQSGNYTVSFTASDGKDQTALTVQIAVANVNRAPAFGTLDPQSVKEGQALTFTVSATDPDGDTVTLVSQDLPTGATLSNGTFTWTPGFDQSGSVTVSFTASDGTGETSATVQITIEDVPRPLTISSISPTRTLIISSSGETVQLSVVAESPDRGGLTYTWKVNGVTQAETGASLSATVSEGTADDVISVTVSDGTESLDRTWTVTKVLLGDFDGNNEVNFSDFLVFVSSFGKTSADPAFVASADFNGNGTVDFPDFLTFVSFFGVKR